MCVSNLERFNLSKALDFSVLEYVCEAVSTRLSEMPLEERLHFLRCQSAHLYDPCYSAFETSLLTVRVNPTELLRRASLSVTKRTGPKVFETLYDLAWKSVSVSVPYLKGERTVRARIVEKVLQQPFDKDQAYTVLVSKSLFLNAVYTRTFIPTNLGSLTIADVKKKLNKPRLPSYARALMYSLFNFSNAEELVFSPLSWRLCPSLKRDRLHFLEVLFTMLTYLKNRGYLSWSLIFLEPLPHPFGVGKNGDSKELELPKSSDVFKESIPWSKKNVKIRLLKGSKLGALAPSLQGGV